MNFRDCFVKPRLGVPVVNWIFSQDLILILTFAINLSIVNHVEPNDPSNTTKFDRAMQPFLGPFHSLWAINMNEGDAPLWFVILFIFFFLSSCHPFIHSSFSLSFRTFVCSFVHFFLCCLFIRLFVCLFDYLFICSMKKSRRKN